MALKNYTTQISVDKTIMEIEKILRRAGAEKILKEYHGDGDNLAISFIINTPQGKMPIRLPMNEREVSQVLQNDGKLPMRLRNDIGHARRVGWRIIKDWLDAQMAILETRMVKVEEVFLPYAYDAISNKTLFQKFEETKFKGMLLESGDEKTNQTPKEK